VLGYACGVFSVALVVRVGLLPGARDEASRPAAQLG